MKIWTAKVSVRVARVDEAAWLQGIKGVCVLARRLEVAVDIDDHVSGIGDVNADRAIGTGGHDGSVSFGAAVGRIQRGDQRLILVGGPDRQVIQVSTRHDGYVQRIGSAGRDLEI